MSEQLQALLNLETAPVAVTFHDTQPDGVSRVEKVEASGCTYWRRAAEGKTFHTEAPDHYNCPIGCYTHNIALPDAQMKELENTLGLMGELGRLHHDGRSPRYPNPGHPVQKRGLCSSIRCNRHTGCRHHLWYTETDDVLGGSRDCCWHRCGR